MKIMTREEAILAMVEGKEVTSDELAQPDTTYCIYDKTQELPFRYRTKNGIEGAISSIWDIKTWRLRKYTPKDKELAWCWDDGDVEHATLRYYDAENARTFNFAGRKGGYDYDNYAPFYGTFPPNMCSVDDLED